MSARATAVPVPVVDLDLLTATPRERDVWDAGWFWGFHQGVRAGREQATDEAHAQWASMARAVARQGGPLVRNYSDVCEARGEPARAARARVNEARVEAGLDAPDA